MTILDATGLKCPLPVLKAKKALKSLPPGARLEVHATDPGAPGDFAAFCAATGDELVRSDGNDGTFVFVIRKAN
jgi:tRNA 2-thiouridine synthesizing protein A